MAETPDFVEEVRVLRPQPGDIIALRVAYVPTEEQKTLLGEMMESLFPWQKAVVITPGEEFVVIRTRTDEDPTSSNSEEVGSTEPSSSASG